MRKLISDFLDPFRLGSNNQMLLRLARVFHRFAVICFLTLIIYYLQDRHIGILKINNQLALTISFLMLISATFFNLLSGITNGVMANLFSKGTRPYPNYREDKITFFVTFGIYALAFIGEVYILSYI